MTPTPLHEKIIEVTDTLVDIAEKQGVSILINITIIDGDEYKRTLGCDENISLKSLMYASIGHSESIYSLIAANQ